MTKKKKIWVNENIKLPKVQVIDENGKNLGIMATERALAMAKDKGLDLVEIAPTAQPPVCKLLDYGKYQYNLMKKERRQKKKQKKTEVKGVRISPRISENDLNFKAKQADKFIQAGNKVRVEMVIRGREYAHQDLIKDTFNRFIKAMKEEVVIEQEPKKQRLGLAMIITKKK